MDQKAREGTLFKQLQETLKKVDGLPPFDMSTYLVREGEVTVVSGSERAIRWFGLTNEDLMVAKRISNTILRKFSKGSYTFDYEVDLNDVSLSSRVFLLFIITLKILFTC